jgi:hypothetical protein
MNIKEQTKNMSSEDRKNLVKEIIERCVATEPPIEESPYIHVVFCKGRDGWVPFIGYGCDISTKKTVEFINCINDAVDVLNREEK